MVSLIHLTSDSHDDSHLCNSAAGPVDEYHLVYAHDDLVLDIFRRNVRKLCDVLGTEYACFSHSQ